MIWELAPHVSTRIWGGDNLIKLKSLKGISEALLPIGETWEASTHKEGVSKVLGTNQLISDFVNLNYLVKFLDTAQVLSVQVHPNDHYSSLHEGEKGKCECWIILSAQENAGIYLGFKKGVTKDVLKKSLLNSEDISQHLNFHRVKPGDFFLVPPGTIHAIGAGVTLVEVQQSSGVTYRVWDWNRVDQNGKSRELHVDRAFDVLEDSPHKNSLEYFQFKSNIFSEENNMLSLLSHPDFNLKYFSIDANCENRIRLDPSKHSTIVILEGVVSFENITSRSYQTFLIKDLDSINIKALETSKIILVE